MTTVLTLGTFDTPHMGHAALMREAAKLGDRLVVGINSDRFVREYKGRDPIFHYAERRDLVMALGYDVVLNDGPGRDVIVASQVGCDILAVGSDWATRDYFAQIGMTAAEFFGSGRTLAFIPYTQGISTTALRERFALERAGA